MRGYYGKHRYSSRAAPPADFRGASTVGSVILHTIEDYARYRDELNSNFADFIRELLQHMGADPSAFVMDLGGITRDPAGHVDRVRKGEAIIQKSPLAGLWNTYVYPLYSEWLAFYSEDIGFREVFPSVWERLEDWERRLKKAREITNEALAKIDKPKLQTPGPELPTTVAERGGAAAEDIAGGIKGAFGDVWSILKWTAIGGLALVGTVAVASIVHNLRSNKDPVREYAAAYRGER